MEPVLDPFTEVTYFIKKRQGLMVHHSNAIPPAAVKLWCGGLTSIPEEAEV